MQLLQGSNTATELSQLMDLSTRALGFEIESPVMKRLSDSVGYHVNDFGLLDTAKLMVTTNVNSPVWNALNYRMEMLIEGLLFNESGSNVQLVAKFKNWSLVDFCQLVMAAKVMELEKFERIQQLLPYILYEQVLSKKKTTSYEAAVFFETVKRLDVDWQLLQTAILSVELFQAQVPYHDMLTEELANTLDDWFDLMGEFNLQNIGCVYAFIRGEDMDYITDSLYSTTPNVPAFSILDN